MVFFRMFLARCLRCIPANERTQGLQATVCSKVRLKEEEKKSVEDRSVLVGDGFKNLLTVCTLWRR